jgi:hypothetical protein
MSFIHLEGGISSHQVVGPKKKNIDNNVLVIDLVK